MMVPRPHTASQANTMASRFPPHILHKVKGRGSLKGSKRTDIDCTVL
uniref:Uncharacterized protein n=1 Tax=Anguilla anguilla TaxID=7936 RepID=A0A0E9X379_ANGAN